MAFADYSFSGRLTATPGACRVLRNSARARRAFVGEAFAFACSRGDGRDYQMKDRSLAGVSLRWFRGGVIAFLPWGQNYDPARNGRDHKRRQHAVAHAALLIRKQLKENSSREKSHFNFPLRFGAG